jgi:hypothetical protein
MTLFRGLCPECAEAEFQRCRLWYEAGQEPARTPADLEDFTYGFLFSAEGKAGLFTWNLFWFRKVVEGIPEQFVSIISQFGNGYLIEVKRPIPVDEMRQAIQATLAKPKRRRKKKGGAA